MQTTLKTPVTLTGAGLHSGRPARITLAPAAANHGIVFRRTDAVEGNPDVPARWDATQHVPLCTRLVNDEGVSISTVEHVMAALAGLGVHNALIEVGGPEVPILDGSAAPFVKAILKVGLQHDEAPLRAYRVLKPVEVEHEGAVARLEPADGLHIDFEIDFSDAAIGRQARSLDMANGAFVHQLCDSRTFCRRSDVEAMRANGLALGGTMENAVVVDGDDVLTLGGLRHRDEPVRHKMLDALGDLALAGAPILGRYTGVRAGHTLTNKLLRALFATPGAVEVVTCGAEEQKRLPGVGVSLADLDAVA
ncbi:UDP-3-O-[3-hydroxymyristoyl] N-acetylglucosamine deacetylase [Aliiruegeria haliotis]|uniref:UDP-3-O-acyl-N-acetylglucosamine deacetylase n=1 Tax=Aliiruegeria haliotis TaxID=1280846 RepID=A0A2T0RXZ8_9RHOB|nr:UDP-3-O-acyl-N-acetylglucosamine deacetylase [Aliiruegeria haliotis]PRY26012.1 UDP-3-O-[3-hydroxymyristoyl] N-acetylglucosamine deacetylase [Aliiruegeria haliotis]